MAKRAREQKVKEKRARKAEKKQAVQEAKAAGVDPWAHRIEGESRDDDAASPGPEESRGSS